MAGLPWYKCEPAAFNDGMVGLSRTERGAYVTVLNCIYIEGGPVKDQPFYWASLFGCTEAAWLKDRDGLVAKGKLFLAPTADGLPGLMNRRAAEELNNQFEYKSAQAARGQRGGSASRKKPRSDKGISRGRASAKPPLSKRLATAKQIEIERENPNPIQEENSQPQDDSLGDGVVRFLGRGS